MLKRKYLLIVFVLGTVLAACEQPGGLALDPNNGGNNNENNGENNDENSDENSDENNGENNDENNNGDNDENNGGDNVSEYPSDWEDDTQVPPPEVIGIEIVSKPDTIIYPNNFAENGGPDWTGLVVHKVWDDGATEKLGDSEYDIDASAVKASSNGTVSRQVIVKMGKFKDDFSVVIDKSNRVLQSVTYTGAPSAANELGKPFDFGNLAITGNYSDSTTEKVANNACTITGYDMRKRGAQTVTVKVNGKLVGTFSVTTKVPANAEIVVTPPIKGQYKPGQPTGFRPAYLMGERYNPATDAGLAIKVTANGQTIPLTFANGGLTAADLAAGANTAFGADYRFTTKDTNTIRFKLDDTTASYDVFVMDSPGTQPRVYFDYGYRQTADDLRGEGYGDGKYYVKAGSELVLAPVLFLIGYKADYTPDTVSYAWSVSGGSYDTTKPRNAETFTFKPAATPTTYTVTVQVTGRNVITGLSDTKSASTQVVCYEGTVSSSKTFGNWVKGFAPGQFTERGTGFGWSLGAVLGYEIWRASGTSASITGNGFETWNEPGIVWVQRDDNGNGLPDEMWYEIKGSDDTGTYKDNITRRYALTYYRDQFAETTPNQYDQIIRTIYWVDQRGRIGTLGGGWPSLGNTAGIQGESGDWMTYTGTILRDSKGEKLNLGQTNLAPISGYVDVMSGGSQTLTFSASSAIRADGTPAGLSSFSFIKVQTGYFEYGDALGERSTEIVSATGLGKN